MVYEYDCGDGWVIHISPMEGTEATQKQIEQAQVEKFICVTRDGVNIMDDIGGASWKSLCPGTWQSGTANIYESE